MGSILTTHTGSLPRRPDLVTLLAECERGGTPTLSTTVSASRWLQLEAGIDIVNDSEQGRVSHATYIQERLSGFESEQDVRRKPPHDLLDHPDLLERFQQRRGTSSTRMPACTGEVRLRDRDAVHHDLERLRAAAQASGAGRLLMTTASPGVMA